MVSKARKDDVGSASQTFFGATYTPTIGSYVHHWWSAVGCFRVMPAYKLLSPWLDVYVVGTVAPQLASTAQRLIPLFKIGEASDSALRVMLHLAATVGDTDLLKLVMNNGIAASVSMRFVSGGPCLNVYIDGDVSPRIRRHSREVVDAI